MTSLPKPKVAGSSLRSRVLFTAFLVCIVGGGIFLVTRNPLPTAPLAEVHRKNLELRAGLWHLPGQTNGFTGFLLDTYDDGEKKSRSAVSNGLLHGLSEGWHTNGTRQVEEHFVAGTSHGLRTKWHPNGQKLSEVGIVDGKLDGRFQRWDEDGSLAEEVELKVGVEDGVSRAYYPSGFIKAQVRLQQGKVLEQKFWKDGEYSQAAMSADGQVAAKEN